MKRPSIFKSQTITAGVVLAGVLLTPLLSHGCQVRGSSLESIQIASSTVSPQTGQLLIAGAPDAGHTLPA